MLYVRHVRRLKTSHSLVDFTTLVSHTLPLRLDLKGRSPRSSDFAIDLLSLVARSDHRSSAIPNQHVGEEPSELGCPVQRGQVSILRSSEDLTEVAQEEGVVLSGDVVRQTVSLVSAL
jgi:hypothetical protein